MMMMTTSGRKSVTLKVRWSIDIDEDDENIREKVSHTEGKVIC